MTFVRTTLGNPATDASRFLRRLAFIILMIFTPVAELVSHGLIYVLFPIGASVLVIAGVLAGGENAPRRALMAIKTPTGIAVLFLAFWSALSLSWTVFPGDAVERLARTLMTAAIGFIAILSLPQRSKISNIYLLAIGVAVTAAVASPLVLIGPDFFRSGYTADSVLAQRCVMSLVILVWPAIGALALRQHFIIATLLAILVAISAIGTFSQIALAALMVAALVYAAAMSHALSVAKIMASVLAVVFLGAPFFAALLYAVNSAAHLSIGSSLMVFADLVVHDWPRFITGHGLAMVERGIDVGLLPAKTPLSIVFMLWYELGVVGVGGFVFVLVTTLLAVRQMPVYAAPAFLALIAAGIVIAMLGAETAQLWWLTLNAIAAIAMANLVKAHPRSKRPRAPMADHDDEDFEDELETDFDPYQEPDF
ncbi:MAG TPA: hypothetical protein VGG12_08305 [Methylovirgula sp.]